MNDISIKHIDQAIWLKTIEHYPRTVQHMKLLVSIIDKLGIFTTFDIAQTQNMDAAKLNAIYIILRLTNKVYSRYIDHVVKKIFLPKFIEIFSVYFHRNPSQKQLFIDQLLQDLDNFIAMTMATCYPHMASSNIKHKLVEYLKSTFNRMFYKNIMRKMCCFINSDFYLKHDAEFTQIVSEYILFSSKTLDHVYINMKKFLEIIFNTDNANKMSNDIIDSLEKHINLPSLFSEHCMELDIYCEQKLDDEYENNTSTTTLSTQTKEKTIDKFSLLEAIVSSMGYKIYYYLENSTIFKPFIDHKLAKSENELISLLSSVFTKHGTSLKLIDPTNLINVSDYYSFVMSSEHNNKFYPYEKFINDLSHGKLPKKYPAEMLLRIFSRIFGVKIKLIENDLTITEINNTEQPTTLTITMYCEEENVYHTVYSSEEIFVAIGKNIPKTKILTKNNKPKVEYDCR